MKKSQDPMRSQAPIPADVLKILAQRVNEAAYRQTAEALGLPIPVVHKKIQAFPPKKSDDLFCDVLRATQFSSEEYQRIHKATSVPEEQSLINNAARPMASVFITHLTQG